MKTVYRVFRLHNTQHDFYTLSPVFDNERNEIREMDEDSANQLVSSLLEKEYGPFVILPMITK